MNFLFVNYTMQHKSGMNDKSHQLHSEEMTEGNQFSFFILVTNLLNLGCQDPHSHDGAEKFLSYITGEQCQHIQRTNAVKNNAFKQSCPCRQQPRFLQFPGIHLLWQEHWDWLKCQT